MPPPASARPAQGPVAAAIARARSDGRRALLEPEAKAVLRAIGIAVPDGEQVADARAAGEVAARLGGACAVKVVSRDVLHKSDSGGVRIGLVGPQAAAAAVAELGASEALAGVPIDGWLVEAMAPAGVEMVIGAVRDPDFGPLVMVGLGGVFVEVLRDVAFGLVPLERADAEAMIGRLRGRALLDGVRGRPAASRSALVDLLLAIGGRDGFLERHGDAIAELDLNPVIVSAQGAVVADARVILAGDEAGCEARMPAHRAEPVAVPCAGSARPSLFESLLRPAAVAVLGASATGTTIANTFIRRLKAFGYRGPIWPVHPGAERIEDLPVLRSLADAPGPIDYTYVAIGAARVADALRGAAGRLRVVQVISSGFAEVEEGQGLEQELLALARRDGFRVVGPNCLGTYSPRGGLTFPEDAPRESGPIGVIAQSGGLSTDIVKRGQSRGVRFSGLVTIGNACDVGAAELVEHFTADPHTRAIGLYLESARDGRALYRLLRGEHAKPVVLMKGGRTRQGTLAAASHTGSLAGDLRAWEALCEQTPCVAVDTVDRFVDALLALQVLALRPQRPTRKVVLFGNGGGTSVLAADYFAALGLDIEPMAPAAVERMRALGLPPGTGIVNPIDTPVGTLLTDGGGIARVILDIVHEASGADALVMHLNLAAFVGRSAVDPVERLIAIAEEVGRTRPGQLHFLLVLRSDGSQALDDARRLYRARALAAGIAVYDEIADAGHALAAVSMLERRLGAVRAS
jgi:acyl-CoA synthetase (NDP forming)